MMMIIMESEPMICKLMINLYTPERDMDSLGVCVERESGVF